jgi:hypothetical protein
MSLFKPTALSERSFFQRIFKQHPQENAVKEVNNLLASKPLLQISRQEIETIGNKYGVNIEKEFKLNLEEFYAVYLNYCLKDKSLSEDELKELKHLKTVLYLDDKSLDNLHSRIGEIIYKQTFQEAVADGRLTKEEEAFLDKLENELRLPKELANKISNETRHSFMSNYVAQIIADQRLSPDEEKEMEAIAASLNIDVKIDDENKEIFNKLKKYWALENLELESIDTDIALQRNEKCHLVIQNVNWYELRSVRQRLSYSGYSTSFKVAKGFYLRSGSYKPRSYSTDEIKLIDNGTLYLTNKRIIFTGLKKNSNIKLDKILSITPYSDGLEIDKETGKSPTLSLPQRPDVFCIILERLLRERNF